MSGGYSLAVVHWLLTATASLVAERGLLLQSTGFSCCRAWASLAEHGLLLQSTGIQTECIQVSVVVERGLSSCGSRGSTAQAQELWPTDSAAPQHVGSSWIRDRTRVSCIGRWILYR